MRGREVVTPFRLQRLLAFAYPTVSALEWARRTVLVAEANDISVPQGSLAAGLRAASVVELTPE